MTTSLYFNNFGASNEQGLINDLIVESIKIYGNDVYYCPRTVNSLDEIYGEDDTSTYESAYFVEMYIKSVDGFEGDGIFLSKFGLQIRDQVTFSVAKRTFDDEVGQYVGIQQPKEGDLIYFMLNPERPQLYQVKYVNDRSIFYQMGGFQVFDLVCEVFEYSGERLSTGIPDIDAIERNYTIDMAAFSLQTQDGFVIITQSGFPIVRGEYSLDNQMQDFNADNDEIQLEADAILDWAEIDPFSEGFV
jgi:hypothetical protein